MLFHPQPSHTIAYNHCLPPAGKYHFNSNSGIIVFNNPSYFFLLIYNKKIRLSLNIGLGEVYFYWSNLKKTVNDKAMIKTVELTVNYCKNITFRVYPLVICVKKAKVLLLLMKFRWIFFKSCQTGDYLKCCREGAKIYQK